MGIVAERRKGAKDFLADLYEQADVFATHQVGDDKMITDALESLKNCIAIHGVIVAAAIREAEILRK